MTPFEYHVQVGIVLVSFDRKLEIYSCPELDFESVSSNANLRVCQAPPSYPLFLALSQKIRGVSSRVRHADSSTRWPRASFAARRDDSSTKAMVLVSRGKFFFQALLQSTWGFSAIKVQMITFKQIR